MDRAEMRMAPPWSSPVFYCFSLLLLLSSIVTLAQAAGACNLFSSDSSSRALAGTPCGNWSFYGRDSTLIGQNNAFSCGLDKPDKPAKPDEPDEDIAVDLMRKKRGIASTRELESRMSYGSRVLDGEFPSHVRLTIMNKDKDKSEVLCGGTIISEDTVMTASSCIADGTQGITAHTIYLGNRHDPKLDIPRYHQSINALGYCAMNLHDLALVRLAKPFVFNKYVAAACLKLDEWHMDTAQCYSVGTDNREPRLRMPILLVPMKRHACDKTQNATTSLSCYQSSLKAELFKAGNTCEQDRGGAMYCINKCGGLNQQVAVGVASSPPSLLEPRQCESIFAMPNAYTDLYKVRKELTALIDSCSKKLDVTFEKTAGKRRQRASHRQGPDEGDVKIIKASWVPVRKDKVTSGLRLFYLLFTKYPQYMKLFPFGTIDLKNMAANKRLVKHVSGVIDTISFVVDAIGDKSEAKELEQALTALVRRHLKRKVGLEEFTNLGGVLINFITESNNKQPKPLNTNALVTAWKKLYNIILDIVKREGGRRSAMNMMMY